LALVFVGTLALVIARQNRVLEEANARERAAAELAQKTIEDMTSVTALKFLETEKELRPEQKKFLEEALAYYRQSTERTPVDEREAGRQATAFFRMGFLQDRLGLTEPAVNSYRAAIEVNERLAGEHPQVPGYRRVLAESHNNLGDVLARLGKHDAAEPEFRTALKEHERLAAEHPLVPEYRRNLATSHLDLGNVLARLGKRDTAAREYRAALQEQERLAAEHPRVPEDRLELATSHNNLGILLGGAPRISATGR
jgi:tetratricopeptide (TPR) repeat protein